MEQRAPSRRIRSTRSGRSSCRRFSRHSRLNKTGSWASLSGAVITRVITRSCVYSRTRSRVKSVDRARIGEAHSLKRVIKSRPSSNQAEPRDRVSRSQTRSSLSLFLSRSLSVSYCLSRGRLLILVARADIKRAARTLSSFRGRDEVLPVLNRASVNKASIGLLVLLGPAAAETVAPLFGVIGRRPVPILRGPCADYRRSAPCFPSGLCESSVLRNFLTALTALSPSRKGRSI